ncbi:MAG TPA: potassium channel family protein [Mycobacterium sp.]
MTTQTNLYRWERRAEWPLAAAALIFLVLFSVQVLARPQGREAFVLWAISWIVWGLFILDYVVRLYLASNRWHWFVQHLLDFAIVALPLVLGVILLIYTASLAVFDKERYLHGATINSFGKAVWWSITTVTTIGYGDVYPVTNTGRVIAVLLMIGGISLVGVVTAALASWIIERVAEEETVIQAANVAHIEELRSKIRELSQQLRERG